MKVSCLNVKRTTPPDLIKSSQKHYLSRIYKFTFKFLLVCLILNHDGKFFFMFFEIMFIFHPNFNKNCQCALRQISFVEQLGSTSLSRMHVSRMIQSRYVDFPNLIPTFHIRQSPSHSLKGVSRIVRLRGLSRDSGIWDNNIVRIISFGIRINSFGK